MIRDALEFLADQTKKSLSANITDYPGRDHCSIILKPDGSYEEIEHDIQRRRHGVTDLPSLLHAAKVWGKSPVTFWVDPSGVTAVLNDMDHRDQTIHLELMLTPQMRLLIDMEQEGQHWRSQKDTIRLLRHNLDEQTSPSDLVTKLRILDFQRSSGVSSNRQHGKDTLGQEVEAKVQQSDQIPDRFTVNAPVFINPYCNGPQPFAMTLDIDAQQATFLIAPTPGQCRKASDAALQAIVDAIKNETPESTVLLGNPQQGAHN